MRFERGKNRFDSRYRWEIKEYLGGLDWIEEEEISSPFLFLMDIYLKMDDTVQF